MDPDGSDRAPMAGARPASTRAEPNRSDPSPGPTKMTGSPGDSRIGRIRVIGSRRLLVHAIVWLGLIALTGFGWRMATPASGPAGAMGGVTLLEDRVYRTAGTRRVTLDVYLPPTGSNAAAPASPRAAVIAIHGGSWIGGSMTDYRSDPRNRVVIRLAQRGLVVLAIDYELARPGRPSWPAVLGDLREAVRWARRHAREFNIDPNRIVVLGQSAGAHLAALLATLPDEPGPDGFSSRVQAVVSFYGPSDLARLLAARHLANEPVRTFLGDPAALRAESVADSSPINRVSRDAPPMLLIHGSDDPWVPLEHSVLMAEALKRAGVRHQLIVVPGARHGFDSCVKSPQDRDLQPEILAFLESVWNVSTVPARSHSIEPAETIFVSPNNRP